MYDVNKIRSDFPILSRTVNDKPLVYLDNGASAQKPQVVIDAISHAYSHEYSNVHRGLHYLSNLATDNYESVRGTIAKFLNVADEDEIVFTSGTTEGINLVAYGWAMPNFQPGDEVILSVMEHHANIVPWHFLRERQGVVIKWVDVDANGALDPQAVLDAITPKTRLIAVTHVSNVLGTVVDVKAITAGVLTPRACLCWSMGPKPRCTCQWMFRTSIVISMQSPVTSFMVRRGPVPSISRNPAWRRCVRFWAAGI